MESYGKAMNYDSFFMLSNNATMKMVSHGHINNEIGLFAFCFSEDRRHKYNKIQWFFLQKDLNFLNFYTFKYF